MRNQKMTKRIVAGFMLAAIWLVPIAGIAQQTKVTTPKNKYKVQEDIKLGNDAAKQIEAKFPILNDDQSTRYVENVGARLVRAIPSQFRQSSFYYRFKIINASDINAMALPGGPMYVNRGMIEKAKNEGEMAGVMAHEISHVALRHATANATKQSSAKNTLGMLGMIIGGAILGGEAGAQLGMLGAAAWMTKYSREAESQADILGAQIMADAGYDPRDLANMFRTIAGERSGGGAPEWLSSHPDPGSRYEKINREAQYLNVSPEPIKITREFERVQARLRSMPQAKTMAQIERETGNSSGQTGSNPTSNGRYTNNVAYPSSRSRAYTGLNWLRISVPSNWSDFGSQDDVIFAPQGAYGDQGITHGVMTGIYRSQANDLYEASNQYLNSLIQGNQYLSRRGQFVETRVAGREGYSILLSGRSPITRNIEVVSIYTAPMRSGDVFYVITVSPETQTGSYNAAFRRVLNSIRIND